MTISLDAEPVDASRRACVSCDYLQEIHLAVWRRHAALMCAAVVAFVGSMIWHEAEKANAYRRELEALEHTAE